MVRYFSWLRAAGAAGHRSSLGGRLTERESRFLCERLCLSPVHGKAYEFAFERGLSRLVDEIARELAEPAGKEGAAMAV